MDFDEVTLFPAGAGDVGDAGDAGAGPDTADYATPVVEDAVGVYTATPAANQPAYTAMHTTPTPVAEASETERRVDESDGGAYTLDEFVYEYGGTTARPPAKWLASHAVASVHTASGTGAAPSSPRDAGSFERRRDEAADEFETMFQQGGAMAALGKRCTMLPRMPCVRTRACLPACLPVVCMSARVRKRRTHTNAHARTCTHTHTRARAQAFSSSSTATKPPPTAASPSARAPRLSRSRWTQRR